MSRQLQFSVRRRRVQCTRGGRDPQYAAYLDAIADVDASVELFDPSPRSSALAQTQRTLGTYGLNVGTVHGPHLQGLLDRDEPRPLLSHVRAKHLTSTIDRMPEDAITPDNVRAFRRTAAELGVGDSLAFTCDIGHAADRRALLAAMEPVVNVHLHSSIDVTGTDAERLCDRFGIEEPRALGELDRPAVARHLLPSVGDLDVESVFERLDARGYDGPITVELSDVYQHAPIVSETAETLAPYL